MGTINVILAAPRRIGSYPSRVMYVTCPPVEDSNHKSKKARMEIRSTLNFSNEDKVGIIQSYDNALVVTLMIRGYDVKRVLVDRGSGAKLCTLICTRG